MALTETEKEALLLIIAADLAKRRLRRGVKLNDQECIALITAAIREGASVGMKPSELIELGRGLLHRDQVLGGTAESLREVKVEVAFPEGIRLVTIPYPITG
ncbi:urease subunit gamma [Paenibacillus sp. PL2-23]|uniref:urease subunit gamma n=1 Tax=Paenibacillus sp. PL2-23 TaxID=2100729 RepID=UPI0030F5C9FE